MIARRRAQQRPRYASREAIRRAQAASSPAARRAVLLRALRGEVLSDARRRARAGVLKGPFIAARCDVAAPDASRPHNAPLLRYQCLAITYQTHTHPPLRFGSPYLARVDFARPNFAYCLFTPVGGEGAHTALTFAAPPPAACAAAHAELKTTTEGLPCLSPDRVSARQ